MGVDVKKSDHWTPLGSRHQLTETGGERDRSGPLSEQIADQGHSTTDQTLDAQVEKLKAAGAEVIRSEKMSGTSR